VTTHAALRWDQPPQGGMNRAGGGIRCELTPGASNRVTALDVYGSLLYAGSRTMQSRLPTIGEASRPAEVGGRLYLSGIDPRLMAQFMRTGRVDLTWPVRLFGAAEVVGGSTHEAYRAAQMWLVQKTSEQPDSG
jgi:SulP family sulfate permease